MKKKFQAKLRQLAAENRQALTTRTARVGGYSVLLALIVLAILVAVNVLFRVLPSKYTQFDISAAQLYSLTSDTKVVVTNLDKEITIYWIAQAGQESTVLDKLLDRYQDLSDHITVVKKNPDTYPTFAQQYTDETVVNNSLVVECGDKNRYISYNDICSPAFLPGPVPPRRWRSGRFLSSAGSIAIPPHCGAVPAFRR